MPSEDELSQLRTEVALLRAQQQQWEAGQRETDAQKQQYAEFLAWIALSVEEKTQKKADLLFAGLPGDLWEVQLIEHPRIRLPAASTYDAIGKYNELCGITSTEHTHHAVNLSRPAETAATEPAPPALAPPHGRKAALQKGR